MPPQNTPEPKAPDTSQPTPAPAPEMVPEPKAVPAAPPVSNPFPGSQGARPVMTSAADADSPFATMKPEKDIWSVIWKTVFIINVLPAAAYLLVSILKLFGIAEATLGPFMLASSFTIVPALVLVDILYLSAFYMLKRPKFNEIKTKGIRLSIALVATVVLSLVYMVLASSDIQI